MAKCWRCGTHGIFLKLASSGLCLQCQKECDIRDKKTDSIIPVKITISTHSSSYYVDIKQKTPGCLVPAPIEAWDGYVSPSGGYVNFARYQVVGKNPATNRNNKRIYEEFSEEYAIKRAEIDGLVGPFAVSILASIPPTDNQIAYAKDLGATIPEGACFLDVSAIISRINDDDEVPPDENVVRWAHIYGLKFSRYHGKKAILHMARSLPPEDYRDFLSMI